MDLEFEYHECRCFILMLSQAWPCAFGGRLSQHVASTRVFGFGITSKKVAKSQLISPKKHSPFRCIQMVSCRFSNTRDAEVEQKGLSSDLNRLN